MSNFFLIIGPQAVGKMSVGKKLAEIMGYQFSHNHHSIEFGLKFYEYGTPAFKMINNGIRKLLFETMIKFEEAGFVFTYTYAFNSEEDTENLKELIQTFTSQNWKPYIVELETDLETRLIRNKHDQRLSEKASKRDIEASENRLLRSLDKYILNSTEEFPFPFEEFNLHKSSYLKIVNTDKSIEQQANLIIEHFNLDTTQKAM